MVVTKHGSNMRRNFTKRWHKAYAALYGAGAKDHEEAALQKAVTRRKPNRLYPTEEEEQIMTAVWLTKQGIPFFHIPNGGYRDYREAAKLKRMGVQAGIPDLMIPIPNGIYHSLYIELKRIKCGKISDVQKYWLDILNKYGHKAIVCYGANEAIKEIE